MGGSKKPGACASVLDGLSVRAPRTITIFDWRLFCLHKLLVVLILGYVVLQADYLAETVHTGVFAVWAEAYETSDRYFDAGGWCAGGAPCDRGVATVASYADAQQQFYDLAAAAPGGAPYAMCGGNPDYTFFYSAAWVYGPYNCTYPTSGEVWFKTPSSMFITTSTATTVGRRFRAPDAEADAAWCAAEFAARGVPCASGAAAAVAGECACNAASYAFNVGAEHLAFGVLHGFTSEFAERINSGAAQLPRTEVRRADCTPEPGPWYRPGTDGADCNVREFKAGELLKLTVVDLLDIFGLTLDAEDGICTMPFGSPDNAVGGVCPKIRVAGVEFILTFKFYNFNKDSSAEGASNEAKADREVVCVVTVEPKLMWTSRGPSVACVERASARDRERALGIHSRPPPALSPVATPLRLLPASRAGTTARPRGPRRARAARTRARSPTRSSGATTTATACTSRSSRARA